MVPLVQQAEGGGGGYVVGANANPVHTLHVEDPDLPVVVEVDQRIVPLKIQQRLIAALYVYLKGTDLQRSAKQRSDQIDIPVFYLVEDKRLALINKAVTHCCPPPAGAAAGSVQSSR